MSPRRIKKPFSAGTPAYSVGAPRRIGLGLDSSADESFSHARFPEAYSSYSGANSLRMQHEAEQTENVVSVLIDHAILEADVIVIL